MLSDRSPRSIQKIVTLRNRATLDPRQCKILLSLSFFSSPSPLLILLSSFYSLSFSRCVRFADHRQSHSRCARERDEEDREASREREMVLRLKEVATDVEVTTSVCQRRLTIRIFRYFYRSNVPLLLRYCSSSSFFFCLVLNDLPRYIYISFNSLALIRCSRGISQPASILRDYDSNPRLIIAQTLQG